MGPRIAAGAEGLVDDRTLAHDDDPIGGSRILSSSSESNRTAVPALRAAARSLLSGASK